MSIKMVQNAKKWCRKTMKHLCTLSYMEQLQQATIVMHEYFKLWLQHEWLQHLTIWRITLAKRPPMTFTNVLENLGIVGMQSGQWDLHSTY